MRYYYIKPKYFQHANVFGHDDIKEPLTIALLNNDYTEGEINQILKTNFQKNIKKTL